LTPCSHLCPLLRPMLFSLIMSLTSHAIAVYLYSSINYSLFLFNSIALSFIFHTSRILGSIDDCMLTVRFQLFDHLIRSSNLKLQLLNWKILNLFWNLDNLILIRQLKYILCYVDVGRGFSCCTPELLACCVDLL
jgi:hypothetical protein